MRFGYNPTPNLNRQPNGWILANNFSEQMSLRIQEWQNVCSFNSVTKNLVTKVLVAKNWAKRFFHKKIYFISLCSNAQYSGKVSTAQPYLGCIDIITLCDKGTCIKSYCKTFQHTHTELDQGNNLLFTISMPWSSTTS